MKYRVFTNGYLVVVGVCLLYLVVTAAFGEGGPYDPAWATVAVVMLVLTLPWSWVIYFLSVALVGFSSSSLHPIVPLLLFALLFAGAAALNAFLVNLICASRANKKARKAESWKSMPPPAVE